MIEDEHIKSELKKFAERFGPSTIMPATVLAVAEDDTLKIEFSDGLQIEDVRLKAVVKAGNKMLLLPKINTEVLVGRIENSNELCVLSVNEVDKVIVIVDNTHYEISADGFLIKRGNDTLKQVVQLIIEAVQQVVVVYGNNPDYVKLETALNKLNNILL